MQNRHRTSFAKVARAIAVVSAPFLIAALPLSVGATAGWFAVSPAAAQTAAKTYDLAIKGGQLPEALQLIRVKQGDHVTLRWTADAAMEIHLHGYDIEKELKPGANPEVMDFTADIAGRFPVEIHQPEGGGGGEEPVILHLEVYP